jgi:hypothetical protein
MVQSFFSCGNLDLAEAKFCTLIIANTFFFSNAVGEFLLALLRVLYRTLKSEYSRTLKSPA